MTDGSLLNKIEIFHHRHVNGNLKIDDRLISWAVGHTDPFMHEPLMLQVHKGNCMNHVPKMQIDLLIFDSLWTLRFDFLWHGSD